MIIDSAEDYINNVVFSKWQMLGAGLVVETGWSDCSSLWEIAPVSKRCKRGYGCRSLLNQSMGVKSALWRSACGLYLGCCVLLITDITAEPEPHPLLMCPHHQAALVFDGRTRSHESYRMMLSNLRTSRDVPCGSWMNLILIVRYIFF